MSTQNIRPSKIISISLIGVLLLGLAGLSSAGTVLITGANSGIGLEFSKQYAEKGWTVIATHRRDDVPDTLTELSRRYKNVRVETMDVTNREQVFGLAKRLQGQPIDVLINNAGIFCFCDWMDDSDTSQVFGSLEFDHFGPIMEVNVRGIAMVSEAFKDHVKASNEKKMITMASTLGSLSNPESGLSAMWYAASKAAGNRVNVVIAETLRPDNVIVVPMHPGSVRVEKQADVETSENPQVLETNESVAQMVATIDQLDMDDSGKLLRYDGVELPW